MTVPLYFSIKYTMFGAVVGQCFSDFPMESARLFFGVSFGGEGAGRRFCMVLHD